MSVILGTPNGDVIVGGAEADDISGLGGPDTLYGGRGSDTIRGGEGNDELYAGVDDLFSGYGDDATALNQLYGEGGADVLRGAYPSRDTLSGGDGADTIMGGGGDLLLGGDGNDTLTGTVLFAMLSPTQGGVSAPSDPAIAMALDGGAGDDVLSVTGSGSRLIGGAGGDRFIVGGGFVRDGGANLPLFNTIADFNPTEGDRLDLGPRTATQPSAVWRGVVDNPDFTIAVGAILTSDNYGSNFAQGWTWSDGVSTWLILDADGDGRLGANGDVVLKFEGRVTVDNTVFAANLYSFGQVNFGTANADTMTGNETGDNLHGAGGDDLIYGYGASDAIFGEAGYDTLVGGAGNDRIFGGTENDAVWGGVGDDYIWGDEGDDWLVGDDGFDQINGNMGADTIHGGDGVDWVRGGQGDDVLDGGAGNDWMAGDRGSDTVTGGAGADTFYIFSGAGIDRVTDFFSAQGDRVLLGAGQAYTLRYTAEGAVIDLGNGDQLILVGVTASSIGDWLLD